MGILSTVKRWFDMLLANKLKENFDITPITSSEMDLFIQHCADVYAGKPLWADEDSGIGTINFAKSVCSEVARLATLGIGITIDGSARAEWLQAQIDKVYFNLRHWTEYGGAYGTIILKPNGDGIDVATYGTQFVITDITGDKITGAAFYNYAYDPTKKKHYTRIEWHRFLENDKDANGRPKYAISNRCYVGNTAHDAGKPIPITDTPWRILEEDVVIEGVEKPLFAVLRMPMANNIDVGSPLGMPIFSDAIEEMKDLDIAYSRNAKEIFDSKRTVLLDSDRLLTSGNKISNTIAGFKHSLRTLELPDYIKAVFGDGRDEVYHEINPTLNTETRLKGINALLSQIGYKCGFSNGYFVFNESGGVATATQVEADQQRTIQLIKDVRDKLESCLDDLLYALDKFADLYDLAPVGAYEPHYAFGDITYNHDEDRSRWYGYAVAGKVPFWYYLTKFENMSEEDAKALEDSARPKETLFGDEE